MKKIILIAALAASSMTSTAMADDIGFGALLSFNTSGEISFGPRVYWKNEKKLRVHNPLADCAVGAINCGDIFGKRTGRFTVTGGVNYNFTRKAIEPAIGAGYTLKNGLVATEATYNFEDKKVKFNLGAGWSDAKRKLLGSFSTF